MSGSPYWSIPFRFLTKILYTFLISPMHPPCFDLPNNIWQQIQITMFLMQFSQKW